MLKSLGYNNKRKSKAPMVLDIDSEVCYDQVTIAEHINDFFINVSMTCGNLT